MTRFTSFLIKAIDAVIDKYLLKPDLEKLFGSIDTHVNITSLKLVEQERESRIEFLSILNKSTNIKDMISGIMLFISKHSGCSAVGIRLRDDENFPYYVTYGLPVDFVHAENSFCSKNAIGEVIHDYGDNVVLGCMCGDIICGRFDPEKPYFTAHGSYWTNSTTWFNTNACDSNEQRKHRNRCNSAGFESVAFIPLIAGQDRLGLLQLYDHRQGVFSPEDISRWEMMAGHLAIAVVKFRTEETLKKLNEELDFKVQERTYQLEKALNWRESFCYSTSHDLRTPLHQIHSYLDIVSEDFGELLPPEAHGFLDRARATSLRICKIIDDPPELSQINRHLG